MEEGRPALQEVGKGAGAGARGGWMVCVLVRELEGPVTLTVVPGRGQSTVDPMCPLAARSAGEEANMPGNSSMTSWIAPRITSVMSPGIETPSGRTRRWLFTSAMIRDGSRCSKNARNSPSVVELGSGS